MCLSLSFSINFLNLYQLIDFAAPLCFVFFFLFFFSLYFIVMLGDVIHQQRLNKKKKIREGLVPCAYGTPETSLSVEKAAEFPRGQVLQNQQLSIIKGSCAFGSFSFFFSFSGGFGLLFLFFFFSCSVLTYFSSFSERSTFFLLVAPLSRIPFPKKKK